MTPAEYQTLTEKDWTSQMIGDLTYNYFLSDTEIKNIPFHDFMTLSVDEMVEKHIGWDEINRRT